MNLLLALLLSVLPAQYLNELDVKTLNFEAQAFKDAFNANADVPRLVVVFSPT